MAPFDFRLLDALEASTVPRVSGTAWREILLPTAVMRPNQRGARWNPLGAETLYCSLEPATASAEVDYLLSQQSVPVNRQRTIYALRVSLSRAADLRPQPWAQHFKYPYDPHRIDACQEIGAAAAWLGLSCLLVPSQRAAGDNLVVFVANLDIDDILEPIEPSYEDPPGPPDDLSWDPIQPG